MIRHNIDPTSGRFYQGTKTRFAFSGSAFFLAASLIGIATLQLDNANALPVGGDSASTGAPVEKLPDAKLGQYVLQLKAGVYERFCAEKKSGKSLEDCYAALSHQLNAKVTRQVRKDIYLVQRGAAESRNSAIKTLQENSLVAIAEPNFIYRANRLPNDPMLGLLWGLKNIGAKDTDGVVGIAGIDIDAERAWDITTGSDQVVVAVIDTGIDYNQPDLKANIWINQAEKNGKPGVDDDGNGVIDDVYGADMANNDGDPIDDQSHGSHCAGTIGGRGNDGKGLVGVNWNVKLMAVKFLNKDGEGTLDSAILSIDYARAMGAKIMSNSWGGGGVSDLLRKAIEGARDGGALFVAAAGNSALNIDVNPEYPAAYEVDNILAVAAVDNRGALADFSNYGAFHVHVAAPGVNIVSTVSSLSPEGPKDYDSYSGTSMATPHVAGIAALLLANEPGLKYQDLKARIVTYSRPRAALRGSIKAGMANAFYALSKQTPPLDPNDPANFANQKAISASTPHPYIENTDQTWTFKVAGAKRLAVRFAKFESENGYDAAEFQDSAGKSFGFLSGFRSGSYSPVVNGDTIVIKFHADPSVNFYGFDADSIYWE